MMKKERLPHYTHLAKGTWLRLDWLSSVSVNDYPTARPLDWHDHTEMEVIFPVRGNFHYEFADAQTVDIDGNSFMCIPRGVRHRPREAIDAPGNRFSLHLKKPSSRFKAGALTPAEYRRIYEKLLNRPCIRANLSPLQKVAVGNLWKLINRPQGGSTAPDIPKIRLLLCQLLCESGTPTEPTEAKSSGEIMAEAKKWLERNAADMVNLDDLVTFIGYSRARLFASFKEHTGLTPGEYLRNHRIEKAKALLTGTSQTSVEIAKTCGLGDPAHFCRLFYKMTGTTPSAYRTARRA